MADESMDILSLKALQCILFAAAATNDRECIEIIFSTSAGTDESQALEPDSSLESDDDQSNYFADDETSICQSPSASEFSIEDECIKSKCELPLLLAIQ